MDELVKLVSQNTGLPADQAKVAVETVITYLKERLPAPLAGQVDALLANEATVKGAEDLLKGLGGLLGKK